MRQLFFKRHRFPPDIIRHSIWLYARFTLSYRDVEEMLAERGLNISYKTVRRWLLKCHLGNVSQVRSVEGPYTADLREKVISPWPRTRICTITNMERRVQSETRSAR